MRCCGQDWVLPSSAVIVERLQYLKRYLQVVRCRQVRNGAPRSWSREYRYFITAVVCIQSFSISYAASAFSVAKDRIAAEFRASAFLVSLGISVFTLGVAIAPLLFAPLSEAYGRRPLYIVSWILYTATFFITGFSPSLAVFLVGRSLMGIFGSVSSTVVGGTLSDMWLDKDRGNAMAIFAYSALLGTASGPLTMGYVAQNVGWRAIEYLQLGFNAFLLLIIVLLVPETLSTLSNPGQTRRARPKFAPARPILFLLTEPIVALLSLWISFAWGVLYLFLEAIPLVGLEYYGLDTGQQGLSFAGLAIGFTLGLCAHFMLERFSHGESTPERRFLAASLGGWLFPIGLLWFGLGTYSQDVLVTLSGTACAAIGLYVFYLAIFNYLGDVYVRHTASALASQSFLRNLFSTSFPLLATAFFTRFGPVKASAIMAAVAAFLSTFPIVLRLKGSRLRARSKYTAGQTIEPVQ